MLRPMEVGGYLLDEMENVREKVIKRLNSWKAPGWDRICGH